MRAPKVIPGNVMGFQKETDTTKKLRAHKVKTSNESDYQNIVFQYTLACQRETPQGKLKAYLLNIGSPSEQRGKSLTIEGRNRQKLLTFL